MSENTTALESMIAEVMETNRKNSIICEEKIAQLTKERDFLEEQFKEAVNQLGIERNERDKSIEMIHRSSQDINRLEQERDELAAKLQSVEKEKYIAEQSVKLSADLFAEERAKCAEMRDVLEETKLEHMGEVSNQWFIMRDRALSDQCGVGWLSPDKAGRLREAAAFMLECSTDSDAERLPEAIEKLEQALEETKQ